MLLNLLKTDVECFFFFFPVLLFGSPVFVCCNADHRLERLGDLLIGDFLRSHHDISKFHSPCRLHDYLIPALNLQLARSKKINFPCSPETDSYYFCHRLILLYRQ